MTNDVTKQLETTITQMKEEILHDVRAGHVPRNCASFGELHDYRDANCYGGFCDDDVADELIEQFGGRDADEGMPDGMINFMNAAQGAIDQWIKEGGLL